MEITVSQLRSDITSQKLGKFSSNTFQVIYVVVDMSVLKSQGDGGDCDRREGHHSPHHRLSGPSSARGQGE